MLAAIAASALAAGQAQAKAVTDWAQLDTVGAGDTLTVSGSGSIAPNDKEFSITLDQAGNFIKTNDSEDAATFTASKGSLAINGTGAELTIGTTSASGATVTLKELSNTKGTLTIQGKGADKEASALKATTIKIGVDSANADEAVVIVKGHGSLNATGAGEGEGLLIGKGAKLTIEENGIATGSKIVMTGGKVAFSGAVGTAILGSDTSVIDITGGTITNDTRKGGGIKGATINLGGEGKIEAAHNINITAGDGGFNVVRLRQLITSISQQVMVASMLKVVPSTLLAKRLQLLPVIPLFQLVL